MNHTFEEQKFLILYVQLLKPNNDVINDGMEMYRYLITIY